MTVYADVLVALNICFTYIFLVSVRLFLKIPTNKYLIALASFLGGLSSLIIFVNEIPIVLSVAYKIVTSAIIVLLGFTPKSIQVFLKEFLLFWGVNILFGGVMYFIEITFKHQKIQYVNGVVYFDMSMMFLVGSVLCVYGLFLICNYLLSSKMNSNNICNLTVFYNGTEVTLPALFDTGNGLTDGISGRPVIICELSGVAPLFTRQEVLFFNNGDIENVPDSLTKRIRLVPCNSLGGSSLLTCFLPDAVKIKNRNNTYKTDFCAVGVTKTKLSNGEYKALLNNKLLMGENEYVENTD
ncbi:MAG: sigma-E processing peptidase SpoIIGA [Acutalibacteraceae bacterium]